MDLLLKSILRVMLGTLAIYASGTAASAASDDRPDIVVIIADDCTYSDLPLYGGRNVATPNIDRLASEGLTFDRAFVSMAICTPSRSELYTGLYPIRSGVTWNHIRARAGTRSIAHHMGDLGYRVGIAGKIHVSPDSVFPFEKVPGVTRSSVADVAEFDAAGIREFIARDDDQPFCLVVAFNSPHAPWTVGDPGGFDPELLELPPFLADTPRTRVDFARYLAEIEVLDEQVGGVLEALEEAGRAEETIVLFTSEQGAQFPGAKWTNWNSGVHTGMVVRWPGRVDAGTRTAALVQYGDVLPTLIEAVGGEVDPVGFDGTSFLPVLEGQRRRHRDFAYAMHNNVPEGPPYPIRSVTDGRFHYIRNLDPEALYIERHLMGRSEHNPYWSTWMFNAADDPEALAKIERFMRRPAEHLYDMEADPFEMKNLADDPAHAPTLKKLSDALDAWMRQQNDPGAPLDTRENFEAAGKGNHLPGPTTGPSQAD